MELVYLWVEDYKNIHQQGFNFSGRYRCDYDPDKKELTIGKNDDYVHVFPDNINVTAIVGENGSGKSRILEILIMLMSNHLDIPHDDYKFCAVLYDDENFKYYTFNWNHSINIKNQDINIEDIVRREFGIFTFYYNYSLDFLRNEEQNFDFNKLYHKTDDYKTPILLQPDKSDYQISLINLDYLATRDILNFAINDNNKFENIEKFFTPKFCKLSIDWDKIHKSRPTNNKIFYEKIEQQMGESFAFSDNISRISYVDLKFLTLVYIIQKTYEKEFVKKFEFIKDDTFKELMLKVPKSIDDLDIALKYINTKLFDDLFSSSLEYKVQKIKQAFLFLEFLNDQSPDYKISNEMIEISQQQNLLVNVVPWIQVEFFNKNKTSLYSLSYGQKFLIRFIYSLLNQMNNLTSHAEYKNIFLLLDEIELGLHPQWQKEYLAFILNILKKLKEYNFTLVCSSHSPFILSDIPKENVIFLKDGEQDKTVTIDTFGANIHTLLSHGFFMNDGLMGEFAKSKINEVITLLNRKRKLSKKNQKFCKDIISIIGEPLLQNTLQHQLNQKLNTNETELQRLEREQKEIQAKIDKLKSTHHETN